MIVRVLRITVALAALAAFAFAADITGTWTAKFDTQVGEQEYTYVFKQEGGKLTGVAKSKLAEKETPITEGTVTGDDVAFVENLDFQGMPLRITYKGKVKGETIEFTRVVLEGIDETAVAKKSK